MTEPDLGLVIDKASHSCEWKKCNTREIGQDRMVTVSAAKWSHGSDRWWRWEKKFPLKDDLRTEREEPLNNCHALCSHTAWHQL